LSQQTLTNLGAAFIGESMARNRYTMYSKVARTEGYEQISAIFLETADQEREHAGILFHLLQPLKGECGERLAIPEAEVPLVLGTTAENLQAAMEGEHYENSVMYPGFAETAEHEGHADIAQRLRAIAVAETHHEERFGKLLAVVKDQTAFKKDHKVFWVCRECGYMHEGTEPPAICPACQHATGFYQLKCESY
jgi:rubrerythrin